MRWCSLLILCVPLSVRGGVAPEDAGKKELQLFQGSWKAVSIQHVDGRPATADEIQNTRLVVEGSKFTLLGKDFKVTGSFTINPAKTPKTIDVLLTTEDGSEAKFLGIYQIQGDRRKSCFALQGEKRPTQLSPKKGYVGFEWRRN